MRVFESLKQGMDIVLCRTMLTVAHHGFLSSLARRLANLSLLSYRSQRCNIESVVQETRISSSARLTRYVALLGSKGG